MHGTSKVTRIVPDSRRAGRIADGADLQAAAPIGQVGSIPAHEHVRSECCGVNVGNVRRAGGIPHVKDPELAGAKLTALAGAKRLAGRYIQTEQSPPVGYGTHLLGRRRVAHI